MHVRVRLFGYLTVAGGLLTAGLVFSPLAAADNGGSQYVSVTSRTIVNSQSGLQLSAPLSSGQTTAVSVLGQGGIPNSGVAAIALSISLSGSSADTYLKAWPDDGELPSPTVLNEPQGKTITNTAVVAPGSDGGINLWLGAGTANISIDVEGYFTTAASSTSSGFQPTTQTRIVDSRTGQGLSTGISAGGTSTFTATGGVVPAGATSIVAQITTISGASSGGLIAYAAAGTVPTATTVDFSPSESVVTSSTIPMNGAGQISVQNTSGARVDMLVDVEGYFVAGSATAGGLYYTQDCRANDTRWPNGTGSIAAWSTLDIRIVGNCDVDPNNAGVFVNLDVVDASSTGNIKAWPSGSPEPAISGAQFQAGTSGSSSSILKTGPNGYITVRNSSNAAINVITDVEGWFDTATTYAAQTLPADPGPKPSAGSVAEPSVSPSPTSTGSLSGAPTANVVSGRFTNVSGTPLAGMTVDVVASGTSAAVGSQYTPPELGTTTTQSDGTWRLTLPSPLPAAAQALSDANSGILNAEARVVGSAPDGMTMMGTEMMPVSTQAGAATQTLANLDPTALSPTSAVYPDADTSSSVAPPVDSGNSDADQRVRSASATANSSPVSIYQTIQGNQEPVGYNPGVAVGVDYSSVTPLDNPCWAAPDKILKSGISYITVGEMHAYWDATASFRYTAKASDYVEGVANYGNGPVVISGGHFISNPIGSGFVAGPLRSPVGRQIKAPIRFNYVKHEQICVHGGPFYSYSLDPIGYAIPPGQGSFVYGNDVSSADGGSNFAAAPLSHKSFAPPQSSFILSTEQSVTYTGAGSVFGIGIRATTTYDVNHEQVLTAGRSTAYRHDVWGRNDGFGVNVNGTQKNPRTFYSY